MYTLYPVIFRREREYQTELRNFEASKNFLEFLKYPEHNLYKPYFKFFLYYY